MRSYADKAYRIDLNKIKLSSANSEKHNLRVCEICCSLIKNNIPFITEFRTNFGLRFDVCTPIHSVNFIEVLHTEEIKDFNKKKYHKLPGQLKSSFLLNDTSIPFQERDIL